MSGRLAAIDTEAGTQVTLYTAPANKLVSITVSACNRYNGKNQAYIQICDGQAASEDYIEYGAEINKNGVLERSGIIIKAGQSIIVQSSMGDMSFVCWGITEDL